MLQLQYCAFLLNTIHLAFDFAPCSWWHQVIGDSCCQFCHYLVFFVWRLKPVDGRQHVYPTYLSYCHLFIIVVLIS